MKANNKVDLMSDQMCGVNNVHHNMINIFWDFFLLFVHGILIFCQKWQHGKICYKKKSQIISSITLIFINAMMMTSTFQQKGCPMIWTFVIIELLICVIKNPSRWELIKARIATKQTQIDKAHQKHQNQQSKPRRTQREKTKQNNLFVTKTQ